MPTLNDNIRYLKGVGEKRAEQLNKLGLFSLGTLLSFYPKSYKDLSRICQIFDCPLDTVCSVKARVITDVSEHYIRKNMILYKFTVSDGTEKMDVTLFNNKYLAGRIKCNREYIFYGKITGGLFKKEMSSPEIYEKEFQKILPVYKLTAGISESYMQKIISTALKDTKVTESLPDAILKKYDLCDINYALKNIHFPSSHEALERSKKRLIFDELFFLQAGMLFFKNENRKKNAPIIQFSCIDEFISSLSFSPTNAQLRAIKECETDLKSGFAMNRLIQGDVGSGKTLVAAALCYAVAKCGKQAVLMAPTVILAEQHAKTFENFFSEFNINCCVISSNLKKSEKQILFEKIKNGEINIIVGTHALLNDALEFCDVGLIITDEQHRFGVEQRNTLSEKSGSPHTLVMSATPIPRTLSHVIYGDLDVSIIDEYPKGRQTVESYCVGDDIRTRAYNYVKRHLDEGRQGYIVCPLVSESDSDKIPAEEHFEKLRNGEFKNYRLGLLHGKMSPVQKESVMREFASGEIQLLIATSVIEVGIDVPNAAIIVIENAELFGLSQLHQLRGRVGRGKHRSTCIFIHSQNADTTRLKILTRTSDGFKISEEDLKLRGPGDFFGNRQHGLPELKIADLYLDYDTMKETRAAAEELLCRDPKLENKENLAVKQQILTLFEKN